jgi:hypothetical protein
MPKRKEVKQRCQRRKFLKEVIKDLDEKINNDPVNISDLLRKRTYYKKQLIRL